MSHLGARSPLICRLLSHRDRSWGLELISKRPREDDDHAEVEEGEVVVGFAVAPGRDPSSCFQPGVGALDGPAVAGLRVGDFEASLLSPPDFADRLPGRDRLASFARLADVGADLALGERLFVRVRGVAAVGPQFLRLPARLGEPVEQRQQEALLVLVAGSEQRFEREPAPLDDQVEAAAGCAPECARDLFAPFFASTSEASTITRDQSSLSASSSCVSRTRIACWNNPFPDHSSSRRRQVSPLGKPSSR